MLLGFYFNRSISVCNWSQLRTQEGEHPPEPEPQPRSNRGNRFLVPQSLQFDLASLSTPNNQDCKPTRQVFAARRKGAEQAAPSNAHQSRILESCALRRGLTFAEHSRPSRDTKPNRSKPSFQKTLFFGSSKHQTATAKTSGKRRKYFEI